MQYLAQDTNNRAGIAPAPATTNFLRASRGVRESYPCAHPPVQVAAAGKTPVSREPRQWLPVRVVGTQRNRLLAPTPENRRQGIARARAHQGLGKPKYQQLGCRLVLGKGGMVGSRRNDMHKYTVVRQRPYSLAKFLGIALMSAATWAGVVCLIAHLGRWWIGGAL